MWLFPVIRQSVASSARSLGCSFVLLGSLSTRCIGSATLVCLLSLHSGKRIISHGSIVCPNDDVHTCFALINWLKWPTERARMLLHWLAWACHLRMHCAWFIVRTRLLLLHLRWALLHKDRSRCRLSVQGQCCAGPSQQCGCEWNNQCPDRWGTLSNESVLTLCRRQSTRLAAPWRACFAFSNLDLFVLFPWKVDQNDGVSSMEKDGINVHFPWSLLGLLGEVASRSVLQTELITFSPIQSRWWSGGHLLCHPASMDPNYVFCEHSSQNKSMEWQAHQHLASVRLFSFNWNLPINAKVSDCPERWHHLLVSTGPSGIN